MRIAIVNDVAMATEALRRVVISVPAYHLAWLARDGTEAVERCRQDTPDLILMDLMMPVMDGAEATRRIMAQTPCPILLVTATIDGHFAKVFEALGAGALDVVQTPALAGSSELQGVAALKFKIEAIRRLVSGDQRHKHPSGAPKDEPQPSSASGAPLIVIGASAGGPATLATILSSLPHDFPAAIVIVQHVDAQFVPLMVAWLNERSALSVRTARQGDRPRTSTALIAGTNNHLVFTRACSHYPQRFDDKRKAEKRQEHDVEFFKTRKDAAEAFEAPEQPLNLVALRVQGTIIFPRMQPVGLRRNYRNHA